MKRNRRPQAPPAHVANEVHKLEREIDRLRREAERHNAGGNRKAARVLWNQAKELVTEANRLRNSEPAS